MDYDYRQANSVLQKLSASIENNSQWEQPVPLGAEPPMEFNPEWLPYPLNEYASAMSESIQVPVDMPGVALLSALALCNSKKYTVQVNQDYAEPLNMFCIIVANPSERKSSVLKEITSPIVEYEEQENATLSSEIAKSITEKNILQKELRALEEVAAKDSSKKQEALDKAVELDSFKEIKPKRYLVDDVTIEKLTSMLCDNDGKIGVFSGEGNIFDVFAGQYSKKESFDSVLKSFSGEDLRVDRQGRASEYVKSPALTMLLGIQPTVLETVMSNRNFKGKGLVGRILFSIPESIVGTRRCETDPIPVHVKTNYRNLIFDLMNRPIERQSLILSSGAKAEADQWFYELERRLVTDLIEIQSFGGKLHGLTHRIAGNLHVARYPRDAESHEIETDTFRKAIEIGRYAISHSIVANDCSKDTISENCRYIIDRLKHSGTKEFISKRDLLRLCQKYKSVTELTPYLDRLEEYGYVEIIEEDTEEKGRPSERYLINPYIFEHKPILIDKPKPKELYFDDIFTKSEMAL